MMSLDEVERQLRAMEAKDKAFDLMISLAKNPPANKDPRIVLVELYLLSALFCHITRKIKEDDY